MRRSITGLTLLGTTLLLWVATAAAQDNGLMALDANDDGTIGRQEALSAQVDAFHRMDGDGDGVITADELRAMQQTAADEASRETRRTRRLARERWLTNLDTDDSGDVSLAEYQAAMTPYFDRLDTNGDGVLDGAELRQALEAERAD